MKGANVQIQELNECHAKQQEINAKPHHCETADHQRQRDLKNSQREKTDHQSINQLINENFKKLD